MSTADAAAAIEADLDRAGFTFAEKLTFHQARVKPPAQWTGAEKDLLARYEAVALRSAA